MEKRKYTPRRRAQKQEQTRARIIEAAMALHEELGPRKATISAIAERAGVQRLTVYRHFPDDFALFQACTSRWLALNPPPEPTEWQAVAEPVQRARTAFKALYAYYRRTETMWAVSYRDVDEVPALQEPMAAVEDYLRQVRDDLAAAWSLPAPAERSLKAALTLCLRFATWQTLNREGLNDDEMTDLAAGWITCLTAPAAVS